MQRKLVIYISSTFYFTQKRRETTLEFVLKKMVKFGKIKETYIFHQQRYNNIVPQV